MVSLVKPEAASDDGKLIAFAAFLRKQDDNVVVAEWDGDIVGFGASENADGHISDVWVSPTSEGKGVGSALIAGLEEQMRDREITIATIRVFALNTRALGLYQRLGYRETWRGVVDDSFLGVSLDKIELSKNLDIKAEQDKLVREWRDREQRMEDALRHIAKKLSS